MFKIDTIGSAILTNLQGCLSCNSSGGGGGSSGTYEGTGFFGPGFPNAGTTTPDTMTTDEAISLLRQPSTYSPVQFGDGLGVSDISSSAIVLGAHVGAYVSATGPNNGDGTIAIGNYSGQMNQQVFAMAIGDAAGFSDQYPVCIALGTSAGNIAQGTGAFEGGSIAIGYEAGRLSQGCVAVGVGAGAGATNQGIGAIGVGYTAGFEGQGEAAVAMGYGAGAYYQGFGSVAIGNTAGFTGQQFGAVAIGSGAGCTGQGSNSVAIGINSAILDQQAVCVAIGNAAGNNTQGQSAVAIGDSAGFGTQGSGAIAIGSASGFSVQGINSVALGLGAGSFNQGNNAIAIGSFAGQNVQNQNSIIINATGLTVDSSNDSSCIITPIRNVNGTAVTRMYYDAASGEVMWGTDAPSSIRYKTDVTTMTDEYASAILKLRPVEFKYKSNDKKGIGFIAEEVDEILPELVIKRADTIETVDYHVLVAPIIKIIQQQQQDINQLKDALSLV